MLSAVEARLLEKLRRILSGLVRLGTVTDVDNDKRKARVMFQSQGMTSGWLYVLNNRPFIPDYETEPKRTEAAEGGGGYAAYASHSHEIIIKPWMPKINDTVLVLYLPVLNADGFVLGGVG